MKAARRTIPMILATAAAGTLGFGADLVAQPESVRFSVVPPVEVRLAGNSTLHSWECLGNRLDLSTRMELKMPEFHAAVDRAWSDKPTVPVDFENRAEIDDPPLVVEIPIESLECDSRRMQKDLRKTVKYDEYPVIEYSLGEIRKSTVSKEREDVLKLAVTGSLKVAGVKRPVDHEVRITRLDRETFRIEGRLDLKMSWFDMDPPTAFLGLLRAHDDFKVKFAFQAGIH